MQYPLAKQKKVIYLDHAAATPIDTAVLSVMQRHFTETQGNPSSLHQLGRHAYDILEKARSDVASLLNVVASEIVFTSSGTESDNLALIGLAKANRAYGNHIVVSQIEHKAILEAAHKLEKEGFEVTYLPVDAKGMVCTKTLLKALRDDTILVSIMYANNEIGTVQPIQNISSEVRAHFKGKRAPIIHTDACQATGMLSVSPKELGVDALTLNGSKIYGPRGIGMLYVSSDISIDPLAVGGGQEHGKRAGTENVAAAAGFAEALRLAIENTEEHYDHMKKLQEHFVKLLQTSVPDTIFNGHEKQRLPNNVHICIPEVEGESMVLMLDSYGICCGTGSACSNHDLSPSHVLRAIGRADEIIHGSLRFSFGKSTTIDDLSYTAKMLSEVVTRLKSMTASTRLLKQAV